MIHSFIPENQTEQNAIEGDYIEGSILVNGIDNAADGNIMKPVELRFRICVTDPANKTLNYMIPYDY